MSGGTPIGATGRTTAPTGTTDTGRTEAPDTEAPRSPAPGDLASSELSGNAELQALARGEGSTIGRNSRGPHVRLVQDALVKLGYPLPRFGADGSFGAESMAALQRFQRENGLPATGVVNEATLKKLDEKLAPQAPPQPQPPDPALARGEADRVLGVAAQDGKLETNELERAEAEIAARYGPDKAKEVMRQALGVHLDKLDMAAVDYLNGRMGSMEGHIGRYQSILTEHIKGAKLLDANFDGKLDENDKVFTQDASGKIDVRNVGSALRDKLRIGRAMVESCEEMGRAGHDFALIKDHQANPAFFTVDKNSGTFHLKPGVKPSDAVKDIFANPDKYKFECATALVITYYNAMLKMIGPKDFDRITGDLKIGPWQMENDLRAHRSYPRDRGRVEAPADHQASLRPGDYTYIRNWDVSDEGARAGWQGENVIYMGNGKYYGHPFGVASSETIVNHLNTQRNAGSTRSASFQDVRAVVLESMLAEDRDPNE